MQAHRQGVNVGVHQVAEGGVHRTVTGNGRQADEGCTGEGDVKMPTATLRTGVPGVQVAGIEAFVKGLPA